MACTGLVNCTPTTTASSWRIACVLTSPIPSTACTRARSATSDNEFQHQVDEDLNDNSNEPATKGDVRNLALRVELRFTKLESSIDQRFTKLESSIDQRFTKLESSISERFSTHDSSIKEYVYKLGWKFFGATIGTMGAMFTVFGIFINSSMK